MPDLLTLDASLIEHYADVCERVADALCGGDVDGAQRELAFIAEDRWAGTLRLFARGPSTSVSAAQAPRRVSNRLRAEVFMRDGFRCTYCGGKTIPRNILVAISDVFPELLPYDPHYARTKIHPAYWALAPEADHTVAHSAGGSNLIDNLSTLHTMCNARKSDSQRGELPPISLPAHGGAWDGLVGSYRVIVEAGESRGRRHSSAGYHAMWLRYFQADQ